MIDGETVTGCKKLIITDFDTCSTDYSSPSDIPNDTEVSCLPPNLEIIHDPLANWQGGHNRNLFTINGYDDVHVKNLTIKANAGTSLSQIWQISRILDSLQLDESTGLYTCDHL